MTSVALHRGGYSGRVFSRIVERFTQYWSIAVLVSEVVRDCVICVIRTCVISSDNNTREGAPPEAPTVFQLTSQCCVMSVASAATGNIARYWNRSLVATHFSFFVETAALFFWSGYTIQLCPLMYKEKEKTRRALKIFPNPEKYYCTSLSCMQAAFTRFFLDFLEDTMRKQTQCGN